MAEKKEKTEAKKEALPFNQLIGKRLERAAQVINGIIPKLDGEKHKAMISALEVVNKSLMHHAEKAPKALEGYAPPLAERTLRDYVPGDKVRLTNRGALVFGDSGDFIVDKVIHDAPEGAKRTKTYYKCKSVKNGNTVVALSGMWENA